MEIVGEVSSKTHPAQWKLLTRVSQGPRAAQFPELARLFGQGSNEEKKDVLKKYLTSGESLESCEATFSVAKRHRDQLTRGREELTVQQMIDRGFSEPLVSVTASNIYNSYNNSFWYFISQEKKVKRAARQKIAGCVARGGTPDPDCPNDQKSIRYWAYTGASAQTIDENESTTQVVGRVRPSDAINALAFGAVPVPAALAPAADPLALVRSALADAAGSARTAPQGGEPLCFCDKDKRCVSII